MAAQTGTRSTLVCARTAVATTHSPITSWIECFISCKRDLGRETVILFPSFFFFYFKRPVACHPERSAPYARVAKDLLSVAKDLLCARLLRACGAQHDKLAHVRDRGGGEQKQVLRACGAQH